MLRFTAPVLLLLASTDLLAVPVLFTAAEYSVDVVAGVGADSVVDSATLNIPPDDPLLELPVSASAVQAGANLGDDATTDALVDDVLGELLLVGSTEAGAEAGNVVFVDASATSSLFATFSGAGVYTLMLDFNNFSESLFPGINDASAELFVRIDTGSDTVLERSLIGDELVSFEFILSDAVEACWMSCLSATHSLSLGARAISRQPYLASTSWSW